MADSRAASARPAWKYPLRAAADVALIVLGLLLALWPLLAIVLLIRLFL